MDDHRLTAANDGSFDGDEHRAAGEQHILIYNRERDLVDAASKFLEPGLQPGGAALLIAGRAHRLLIAARLVRDRFDLVRARNRGQYIALDASSLLHLSLLDGELNPWHFSELISGLIAGAQTQASRIRFFTELGAVLWARGKRETALRAEALLSRLCATYGTSLCCAYPQRLLESDEHRALIERMAQDHSLVRSENPDVARGKRRAAAHMRAWR